MSRFTVLVFACLLSGALLAEDKKEAPANVNVKKIGKPAPADASVKEIEVSAKKYEFSPAMIEVPVNTLVKLHLKAIDREHGFELKSVKDSCIKFKPEAPATLEFYADETGEYEFNCCKFCGFGHGKMKGKLVVK